MLRFTDSTAAPSTNYDALPPLARKGAPKNQEKLQNLKKLNQQVWKAKGQNRKMGLDEAGRCICILCVSMSLSSTPLPHH